MGGTRKFSDPRENSAVSFKAEQDFVDYRDDCSMEAKPPRQELFASELEPMAHEDKIPATTPPK